MWDDGNDFIGIVPVLEDIDDEEDTVILDPPRHGDEDIAILCIKDDDDESDAAAELLSALHIHDDHSCRKRLYSICKVDKKLNVCPGHVCMSMYIQMYTNLRCIYIIGARFCAYAI